LVAAKDRSCTVLSRSPPSSVCEAVRSGRICYTVCEGGDGKFLISFGTYLSDCTAVRPQMLTHEDSCGLGRCGKGMFINSKRCVLF